MAALVAAIHVRLAVNRRRAEQPSFGKGFAPGDVDARDKRGHDEKNEGVCGLAQHALEDRVHVLGVVAPIEQRFQLSRA